jgi:hypothetical protein
LTEAVIIPLQLSQGGETQKPAFRCL